MSGVRVLGGSTSLVGIIKNCTGYDQGSGAARTLYRHVGPLGWSAKLGCV